MQYACLQPLLSKSSVDTDVCTSMQFVYVKRRLWEYRCNWLKYISKFC